ncbi:MAG: ferrochelatase [Paucimonas sp.]|nr:ferrochelatase [Paucimonas sp.]
MPFRKEPARHHGAELQTAVVLVNLGTPEEPTAAGLRPYLREFLSDPRVVEIPRAIWWFILNGIIVPLRSRKSAEKYVSIWTGDGSPLKVHTDKQAALLRGYLGERGHKVKVVSAMRYGQPSISAVLDRLKQEGCDRILILPAYPQYSGTTTASIYDAVFSHYARIRNVPELRFVKHYHDHENYIAALKKSVLDYWQSYGRGDKLVMSFHGVPKRTLLLGDPYYCECQKTARLLAAQLGLQENDYLVTFQSRFGKAEWLQPYTEPSVIELAKKGIRRIDVICPGFISDCLETLEEIGMEVKQAFSKAGGKEYHYISCLNESPAWIDALAKISEQHLIGWPTLVSPQERQRQDLALATGRTHALEMGAKD